MRFLEVFFKAWCTAQTWQHSNSADKVCLRLSQSLLSKRGQSAGGVVTDDFLPQEAPNPWRTEIPAQGHAGWKPPLELLQHYAGVPVSHKHFPGTWEVSCIPQQNSSSVHSTSRHMQKIILEIHTLQILNSLIF